MWAEGGFDDLGKLRSDFDRLGMGMGGWDVTHYR
jgi:hypothetical protein